MATDVNDLDLNRILATRARATFRHRIDFKSLPRDNSESMERWCVEHCDGLWRHHNNYAMYFQFEYERDAMMFMLRWGSAEGNIVQ